MKSFSKFLLETKLNKLEGESTRIFHHSSFSEFESFNSLSHFGTRKAAHERIKDKMSEIEEDGDTPPSHYYSYKCRIKLGKILHLNKDSKMHYAEDIANHLHKMGHITTGERDHINDYRQDPSKKLIKVLKDKGYNSLSYPNAYEDRGKKSYIITNPEQVRVLKRRKVALK